MNPVEAEARREPSPPQLANSDGELAAEASGRGNPFSGIPPQAREGFMRVWLEILREKYPGVSWVPAERALPATAEASQQISQGEAATDSVPPPRRPGRGQRPQPAPRSCPARIVAGG
jgi:hypothetical protein